MNVKKLISKTFQRFSRLTLSTEPLPPKAVVIGAPHTSNWDGVLMAIAFWDVERPFKFLVKDSLLHGPVSPIVRWVGGIGVDRKSPHGLVDSIAERAREADEFTLIIAPKGTRAKKEFWKSGFYHIAYKADIPVVLGYIDGEAKKYGWAHSIRLTGDMKADMDVIRAFYEGKKGINPERGIVPRLRGEDEVEA